MARLAEAERLEGLGRLARGVAHDFRNLLGVILNHAAVAADHATASPVEADLERIRLAGERGVEVVNQLLAFSTVRADRPERPSTCATRSIWWSAWSAGRWPPATIYWARPDGPCPVTADRVQLEQAVLNLVLNARDRVARHRLHHPRGGPQPGPGQPATGSVAHAARPRRRGRDGERRRGAGVRARVHHQGSRVGARARHGRAGGPRRPAVRVTLGPAPGGGTTVEVVLPAAG